MGLYGPLSRTTLRTSSFGTAKTLEVLSWFGLFSPTLNLKRWAIFGLSLRDETEILIALAASAVQAGPSPA